MDIISLTGFSDNASASDYLVYKENTSVIVGNKQKAQEIFQLFPRLETVSRVVLESIFAEQQKPCLTTKY